MGVSFLVTENSLCKVYDFMIVFHEFCLSYRPNCVLLLLLLLFFECESCERLLCLLKTIKRKHVRFSRIFFLVC